MSYPQDVWVGVGWKRNGSRVELQGSSENGIKKTAARNGIVVIRIRFNDHQTDTPSFAYFKGQNTPGWTPFTKKDVGVMKKAFE